MTEGKPKSEPLSKVELGKKCDAVLTTITTALSQTPELMSAFAINYFRKRFPQHNPHFVGFSNNGFNYSLNFNIEQRVNGIPTISLELSKHRLDDTKWSRIIIRADYENVDGEYGEPLDGLMFFESDEVQPPIFDKEALDIIPEAFPEFYPSIDEEEITNSH